VQDHLTYPGEASIASDIINRTVDNPKATYYTYDIAGIEYLSLIIPAKNDLTGKQITEMVEIHECQCDTWRQRQRMINFLVSICFKRFGGQGCGFHQTATL